MKQRITLASAAALAALAVPAAAQAHVTLQPQQAPAGAYVVESVRVPNETDDATTTKVAVQFPDGFAAVSYQPVAGWTAEVVKRQLATPVKTDDGEITEGVRQITWTARSADAGIAPGQFRDFPLSVRIPDQAGDTLTFKALQTYSDGTVVRWIGAPDADQPAPQVRVVEAASSAATPAVAAPAVAALSSDGGSDTLGVIALVVGALGLLAGGAALVVARRTP
jgi:uncharacterized protein YcnI